MRKVKRGLLALSIFLCACVSFSCDSLVSRFTDDDKEIFKRSVTENQYEQMSSNIVILKIDFKYRMSDGGPAKEWKDKSFEAIGIKLNDDYILALRHCVTIPRTVAARTPFGNVVQRHLFTKDKKIATMSDNRSLYIVGLDKDIALLSFKEKYNQPTAIDVPIANLDDLRVGTNVYTTGFSRGICKNFKVGIFSGFYNMDDFPNDISVENEDTHKNVLIISMPVSQGDSGSVVFVYNQDKDRMEIVGIIGMKVGYDCYGIVYRMDDVLESINKILTKKE